MNFQDYQEKILMSLVGKSIGGILGAKTENQKRWRDISDIEEHWPAKFPPNDDLDIQILWLEALQEHGPSLTGKILSEIWQDRCKYGFCEYGTFLYNIQRGIMPPVSGKWGNEFFLESNGCPIRAEIWGLVAPGLPDVAAKYAKLDASLDHDIDGASSHIEQFWAVATSFGMVMKDRDAILSNAAQRTLPADSKEKKAFEEIPIWCAEQKLSDKQVWRRVIRNYGDDDASKALTNFAISLFALYRGGDDLKRVMVLCLKAGWDVDCTGATCAAFVCMLYGRSILPCGWMEKVGEKLICGIEVKHKRAPLLEVADDIARCGIEIMLFHNPSFHMADMPEIKLKRIDLPEIDVEVHYEGSPVLHRSKPSRVVLNMCNNKQEIAELDLSLEFPAHCVASLPFRHVSMFPGANLAIAVEISLRDPACALPDKSLFYFHYGEETLAFGLGGVRTWKIYGPYWDMWDSKKYEVCPYDNDKISGLPGAVPGFFGDTYVQYARLDKEYLDERVLIAGGCLPDEDPFLFEAETDKIESKDFAGFAGAACYYLVRDMQYAGDLSAADFSFAIGRGGPCQVWFDGKEVIAKPDVIAWAQHNDEGLKSGVQYTGKPQRLVVKIARQTDEMAFSISPVRTLDPVKAMSWFDDRWNDLPQLIDNTSQDVPKS